MGIFDFIFTRNTFYCIFCDRHKKIHDGNYINGSIGVCSECGEKLKMFPLVPIPQSTEHCDTIISVMPYTDYVRNAFHNYKFKDNRLYASIFAHYIILYLEAFNRSYTYAFTDMCDIIIPVPLSKQRLRERGYNQSSLISDEIAKHFNMPYDNNALIKVRHTKQQSTLPRNLRYKNTFNAYSADSSVINGKRILLFDDIFTTGNTANSCADALLKAGALKVSILTFANRPLYMHTREYYNYIKMV